MYLDPSLLVNQKKFGGIENDITCPICQGIVHNPYFCSKCQNNFCNNCINKWKENNIKCPFRCKNPDYIESKFLKRILSELIKFKCQKGCEKIISYNKVNTHYKNCTKENYQEKYYESLTKIEILKVQMENYNDIKKELEEKKDELEEIQNRNDELENELEEIQNRKDELENKLEEMKNKNNKLENELEDKKKEINNLEKDKNKLNERIKELENDDSNDLKNKIKKLIETNEELNEQLNKEKEKNNKYTKNITKLMMKLSEKKKKNL